MIPLTRPDSRGSTGGRVGAIVVAAGLSSRMNGLDKLFVPLLGRPLLSYTLDAFQKVININALEWKASLGAGGCEMFLAWHSNPADSMGHWQRARSHFEKAIEIAPTKYEPREEFALYQLDLAHFLASRGHLEDAYGEAKAAAEKFIEVPQFRNSVK